MSQEDDRYEPPKQLWFHFHPAPHMVTPDGEERLAASGDLWHDPFETQEQAVAALGENAVEGWIVVGPYDLRVLRLLERTHEEQEK